MCSLTNISSTAAVCAIIAASLAPTSSFGGVMSITDKASVSLPSPTDQVDWRAYPHRHHHWHVGWHYGWPRYRYGMYAGWNPASAPGVYASAAPAYFGAAYPAYRCCSAPGYYGYAGGGLFGLGFPGSGLFGLGLGPL